MAVAIIRPDQVPPEQANHVLRILNQVTSADELAALIEIPGERDIGPRVAKRILDQRLRLGEFRTLEEVAATPYVGPERFSELVFTLSEIEIPAGTGEDVPAVSTSQLQDLQQQINELRDALHMGRRLTIIPQHTQVYLGQPLLLKARLVEIKTGQPLVGYPITLFTNWGELAQVQQQHAQSGPSITGHTGADGIVRVNWTPQSSLPLTPSQRDALETQLDRLPKDAPTPEHARSALETMIAQYHWQANRWFRTAVDTYLKAFHPQFEQNLAQQNPLLSWPARTVSVVALGEGGQAASATGPVVGDSSVQLTAVATVRVIDWLPVWLYLFVQECQKKSDLGKQFELIKELAGGSFNLGEQFNNYIALYASRQPGLAGELASKKIVDDAVQVFLHENLTDTGNEPDLDLEQRTTLYKNLESLSDTMKWGGLPALRNSQQSQTSLKAEIKNEYVPKQVFTDFDRNIDERFVARAQLDELSNQLDTYKGEVNQRFEDLSITRRLDVLEGDLTETNRRLDESMHTVTSRVDDMDRTVRLELEGKADRTEINDLSRRMDTDISRIDRIITNL